MYFASDSDFCQQILKMSKDERLQKLKEWQSLKKDSFLSNSKENLDDKKSFSRVLQAKKPLMNSNQKTLNPSNPTLKPTLNPSNPTLKPTPSSSLKPTPSSTAKSTLKKPTTLKPATIKPTTLKPANKLASSQGKSSTVDHLKPVSKSVKNNKPEASVNVLKCVKAKDPALIKDAPIAQDLALIKDDSTVQDAVKIEPVAESKELEVKVEDSPAMMNITDNVNEETKVEITNNESKATLKPESNLPQLTPETAFQIGSINLDLARKMFNAMKSQESRSWKCPEDGLVYHIDGHDSTRLAFWLAWADMEEKAADYIGVADVYSDAADFLILQQDIMKLREEYQLCQLRMGAQYLHVPEPAPENILTDAQEDLMVPDSKYLQQECPTFDSDSEDESSLKLAVKPEPFVFEKKSGNKTVDLVNMLSNLAITDSPATVSSQEPNVRVKIEQDLHNSMSPPRKPKGGVQKIGVPVADEGSTVTVLTPVRATRKFKNGTPFSLCAS